MTSLVVYDTNYGNTKIIAEAIGRNLGNDCRIESVSRFEPNMLDGVVCWW